MHLNDKIEIEEKKRMEISHSNYPKCGKIINKDSVSITNIGSIYWNSIGVESPFEQNNPEMMK